MLPEVMIETLIRRARYGGRKGRSAARRLRDLFKYREVAELYLFVRSLIWRIEPEPLCFGPP